MSTSNEEALLRAEIARLSSAINRHKTTQPIYKPASFSGRSNTYVNPNYKPAPNSLSRTNYAPMYPTASSSTRPTASLSQPREVVIDGVAFQASGRSLVRKEVAKPMPISKPSLKPQPRQDFSRRFPGTRSTQRSYKPRTSHRKPQNHNMTLTNGRKPISIGRKSIKSMKRIDKQCPRFSLTGVCSKGRTCLYNHDPKKIAICWPFLQGKCPNPDTCSLSHDPIPERTPLCVHFAKSGLCKNGESCLYPHVHVGPRNGVCRDFAVLGYCEKGIDCEQQHVRECPDFAEKGTCSNRACKLPHVIRANQRKSAAASVTDISANPETVVSKEYPITYGDDAQIGDEFISLTFHESSEESSEESSDEEDLEENGENDEDSGTDEDEDPTNIGISVHS